MSKPKVYELGGGEINLWSDPCGVILMRLIPEKGYIVELGQGELEEFIEVLQELLAEIS